jgi:hypothetical protein
VGIDRPDNPLPAEPPEPPPDLSDVHDSRWNSDAVTPYEPISAVDAAMTSQGTDSYPGVDAWANATAGEGDRIWFGSPGISGFGVMEGDLMDVGYDAQLYNEGVQAAPLEGEYRAHLECYEFTTPCDIAVGPTEANKQYGDGGLKQCFVPDVQGRIDDGTLQKVGEIDMTNRQARITVA